MSQLLDKSKSLVPAIRITIELTNNYRRAREIFEAENHTPPGRLPTFENYKKYKTDPLVTKARQALVAHLTALSYDEVVLIKAIMYIGRDEQDPKEVEDRYDEVNYDEIREEAWSNGVFDSPPKEDL